MSGKIILFQMQFLSKFNHKSIISALVLSLGTASCKKQEPGSPNLSESSFPAREFSSSPLEQQREFIQKRKREGKDATYAGMPKTMVKIGSKNRNITILENSAYTVGYDESRHNPAWVAYRLAHFGEIGSNQKAANRDFLTFKTDQRTKSLITPKSFQRSGYERGHLAPSDAIGVYYGKDAQGETFLMSNISPQEKDLNHGLWATLEVIEQNFWANRYGEIWIVAGPIFSEDSKMIGQKKISVPESFYKIYVDEEDGSLRMIAFVIPQDAKKTSALKSFLSSVQKIEELSFLDFNPDLPDEAEKELENRQATEMWQIK